MWENTTSVHCVVWTQVPVHRYFKKFCIYTLLPEFLVMYDWFDRHIWTQRCDQLLWKLHLLKHCLPLLRSSGIQEDSESESIFLEPSSSSGPAAIVSRPSGSSALLPTSSTDRKVLR